MIYSKIVKKAFLLAVAVCPPLVVHAEITPKQVLDKIYGNYVRKNACWITIDTENDQRYCMKIDRADKITADGQVRHYILAAGEAIDENGEPNGAHVTPGMIGAFVLEERGNSAKILAADPKIVIGASGNPPTGWRLVKIGPADYWGWQNTTGDCHQGYCGTRYAILAPHGGKIRDLAGFVASYSDGDACADKHCERMSAALESKLEIDSSDLSAKVFPLLITVSGQDRGKKLPPKTWTVPFDTTKWSYTEPKKWPLGGRDF